MDVITNALEGVRQYFQGLPAASTGSPNATYQPNQANDQQTNHERPTAVPYWPPHHETRAPPSREAPPQRPHHPETNTRPPSHHQVNQVEPKSQQNYYPQNYEHQYQYTVPHAREVVTSVNNHQYQQSHQQSHILPNPAYHPQNAASHPQNAAPQQQQHRHQVPASYHQMQTPQSQSQPQSHYQQNSSFYNNAAGSKAPSNATFKTVQQNSQQYSEAYKYTQQNPSYPQQQGKEPQIKTTHNLPPIAGLSNYPGPRSKSASRVKTSTTLSTTIAKPSHVQAVRPQMPSQNNVETQNYRTTPQYSNSNHVNHSNQFYTQAAYPSSQPQHPQHPQHPQPHTIPIKADTTIYPSVPSTVPTNVDSVLDLSIKTVKTPADSTLDDTEDRTAKYYHQMSMNHQMRYGETYTRPNNNATRPPQNVATAPKVDFTPNFNRPLNHNYEKRNYQQPIMQQQNYKSIVQNSQYHQQAQQGNATRKESLPRIEFPSRNQIQKSGMYSSSLEVPRKRPSETPSVVVENKKPKMEEKWRQAIDKQIEQKFSSYQSKSSDGKPGKVNGFQAYHQTQYQNQVQYSQANQYHMNQTYVPSASAHHYPSHIPQLYQQQNLHRANPQSSRVNNAGADKRVLSILRSNLEMKGAKEAQRRLDQKNFDQRPKEVQQPSTDVMAPFQPKLVRQNVSPFPASSLNEHPPTSYKFPKAIDSVRFEMDPKDDKTDFGSNQADLDGLAANLAARIRTKGELKQMQIQQNKVENTPDKEDVNGQTPSTGSPPKLTKEKVLHPPRRRLFNIPKDEFGEHIGRIPPRDATGLRSSSETSVFDFPDSDTETEMPVLERQSLEAMRRDRKSISKASLVSETDYQKTDDPTDDLFDKACDNFLEQLKTGGGKKRGRRKKIEAEVLAKLETVAKENSITNDSSDIKLEDDIPNNNNEDIEAVKLEEEDSDCAPISKYQKIKEEQVEPKETKPPQEANPQIFSSSFRREIEILKRELEVIPGMNKMNKKKEVESPLPRKESPKLKTIKREEISDSSDSEVENAKNLEEKIRTKKMREQIKKSKELFAQRQNATGLGKPPKKPNFGNGSDFYPGWEEELYKYKKSLRMPPNLIQVTRPPNCQRLSTSLPDLDPCPSPTPSSIILKKENYDSDIDSNSSFNFSMTKHYDSEGSSSVTSLNISNKSKDSILDKLMERYSVNKRRKKYKKKEDDIPKTIPKAENELELLPTPSLDVDTISEKKKSGTILKTESVFLGFRKKTVDSFKDTFINSSKIVGVGEQFTPVVLKSRTRKETRVLKQKATIREVFGEDRPASAPPVTCVDELKDIKTEIKQEPLDEESQDTKTTPPSTKEVLKNKLLSRGNKMQDLLKDLATKKLDDPKLELEIKSETPSLDGDETPMGRKRNKLRNMRRKGSSGFDYIRKKKKIVKKEDSETTTKQKRTVTKSSPESIQDIQKEIKLWVLNKGIGETHLHRSARLGYTDITVYCLEKMEYSPTPKDNAGYTPLHVACARGHLNTSKILLKYGANVSESAQGGIRPLHEAVENGYVEIVRLLLSYGADPLLATYSGTTPLALAMEEQTRNLLQNHINDIQGKPSEKWYFEGPAPCFDPENIGYDPLEDVPTPDAPSEEDEDIDFEVSEVQLPNLYTLSAESSNDRWILLQDLSGLLKIKSKDALLKQINPPGPGNTGNKSILRELKMAEFLDQARCCQFLNAGEKINPRSSKIALVKFTDKVRELLNIEKVTIPNR